MADRREVLELSPEDELEEDAPEEQEPDSGDAEEAEDDDEGEEPTETIFSFDSDEAAPASESEESSVIRDFRRREREKDRRIAELERQVAPKKTELGPKPEYWDDGIQGDDEKFEAALLDWHKRKADVEAQERQEKERAEREREEWSKRVEAYETDKRNIPVADYEDAEKDVFAALPEQTQALILMAEKPAALIYALSRDPARLEELSKLNLARAAMMVGKLEDKVQVKKRALPNPDRPVRGNAAPASADKTLERLEKEASRPGADRSALIRYKKEKGLL